MKTKTILTQGLLGILGASAAFGQASFELLNYHPPVDAPVFDSTGTPLAGTNFLVELWGDASPASLAPAVDLRHGNARVFAPFIDSGYFAAITGIPSIPTVPINGYAWLEVRAWDARLGATYEDVVAKGLGGYGESPLFFAKGGDPTSDLPTSGPLIGLQSFSLRAEVPEPSTWVLLSLGGLGLWCALKRQRSRGG